MAPHLDTDVRFTPDDEPPFEDGQDIELRVPNLEYANQLDRYRATLALNPFIDNDICESLEPRLTDSAEMIVAGEEICVAATEATLVVGYPFAGRYRVRITASTPAGFTRAELFRQIVRVYTAMYEGATVTGTERGYNRHIESPRFGTAWHAMDDLVVEQTVIETRSDGSVVVWVYIGS